MNVLSLCDRTGNMVRDWANAGHQCICVDIRHPTGQRREGNILFVGADVLLMQWSHDWATPAIIFAMPPCTELASSGARWWAQKGAAACFDAVHLVYRCRDICEAAGVPYMIESAVGRLSTIWRKPDYTFDPCDYGDPYTKKTCLWTGGGFVMPPKHRVEPTEGSKMHRLPERAGRGDERSVTPLGFARAVYEANRKEAKAMDRLLCDGCNVRHPWEHRCHGLRALQYGEQTGKACQCPRPECATLREQQASRQRRSGE